MAGDGAPDFMAKDLAGKIFILSDEPKYPVILRFFETNCRFCKADTPVINSYFDQNEKRGLRVVYVSSFYETHEAVEKYREELGITFPLVLDQGARLADLYNVKVYPQTFFIGPDQKIMANLFGGVDSTLLEKMVEEHLR